MPFGISSSSHEKVSKSIFSPKSSSIYSAPEKRRLSTFDMSYDIIKCRTIGKLSVLMIKYNNCNNYEGKKILVFNNSIAEISDLQYIDPHFLDNTKHIHPIARFEPTDSGWEDALLFCAIACDKYKNYRSC